MRVGVVGLNHKLANLKLRDWIARVTARRFCAENSVHLHHTVLLSTCNRTEIYFSSDNLSESHSYILNVLRQDLPPSEEDFDQKLYTYFGRDCFHHLSRVVAGLDSAIVAETEIQGQVKCAYEKAAQFAKLPYELHYIFQKVLRIGKKIRQTLPLDRGMPHIEHAVHKAGRSFFPQEMQPKILIVGASEVNRQVLAFLQKKGWNDFTLCNRSYERAAPIAKHHGVPYAPLSEVTVWQNYHWVILATKVATPLIVCGKGARHPTLMIDLSVPRNVSPRVGLAPDVSLLNIDQINKSLQKRRQRHNHLITEAETIAFQLSQNYVSSFSKRSFRPALLEAI